MEFRLFFALLWRVCDGAEGEEVPKFSEARWY